TKEQQVKEKKLRYTKQSDAINGIFEEICGTKTPLDVKDIFQNCKDKSKQALVLGRAGIGKSTFCRYVANQWANDVIWPQYKLVILLPLRNLTEDRYPKLPPGSRYSSYSLVETEYLFDHGFLEKDRQLLKEQFSKTDVLWLLDGYDEIGQNLPAHLKGLIEHLHKNTHHILTSRPYFYTLSYSVQLEITGFTDDNIAKYVTRFFDQIEDQLQDASSEDQKLLTFLKLNRSIWGVAHIPINLELICSVWSNADWSETKTLTMTGLYDNITEWLCRRYMTRQNKTIQMSKDDIIKHSHNELTFLETLAFKGMENNTIILRPKLLQEAFTETGYSSSGFVDLLHIGILKSLMETPTGTQIEVEKKHYFVHLSFQEYFAARYLVTALNEAPT
ncbi:unnamed protein product, partial [Didymodactylos carnosus]